MMSVGHSLCEQGWQVDVFWDDPAIKKKAEEKYGLSLSRINFVANIFKGRNLIEKRKAMRDYDLIFYISDGSIPFLFGKKNILHFQVPFHGVNGRKPANQLKLKKIDRVVCNSSFTKGFIDKEYGIKSGILYPPVAVEEFKPLKKA